MKKKNRLSGFFAGKGFYAILLVCVAVIGLSGYALFFSGLGSTADVLGDLGLSDAGNYDWDIPAPNANASESLPPISAQWNPDDDSNHDSAPVFKGDIAPPPTVTAPATNAPSPTPSGTPAPTETPKSSKANTYCWPAPGRVLNPFANEYPVFNKTLGDYRVHQGIDIETGPNAKVVAVCDGVVDDVYEDPLMGTTVVIVHNGDIRSVYANLSKTPAVSKGDSVKLGDTIGAVGDTAIGEASETTHLHLEIYKGEKVQNPLNYLPKRSE